MATALLKALSIEESLLDLLDDFNLPEGTYHGRFNEIRIAIIHSIWTDTPQPRRIYNRNPNTGFWCIVNLLPTRFENTIGKKTDGGPICATERRVY